MMMSMMEYETNTCSGTGSELLSESEQDITAQFTDLIGLNINECTEELDLLGDDQNFSIAARITSMTGNADTGFELLNTGDIMFHMHAKMYVSTDCSGAEQSMHFKVKFENP